MIIVTLLYIGFIFGHSATPAVYSSAESSWVTEWVNGFFQAIGLAFVRFSEGFIRKAAHFGEYTGLGILFVISLSRYPFFAGKNRWRLVAAGFLAACIDESIQYFTPGRNASPADVLLDTCGVLFGVAVSAAVSRLIEKKGKKKGGER